MTPTKHYDINYLQNTRSLLIGLKEKSYEFFNGITNGTIVDLGCGAGNDVMELSQRLGSKVKVVGVDHDPIMIEQARAESVEMKAVEFIISDAFPLPFEDEALSGLRTERVIQHLSNPELVIKEISRILKKDHPLVILETDWNSLSFYTEFVTVQKKINDYLTDIKVNNGFAAQKITSYLEHNNFRDVQFEIHPLVINTLYDANQYFLIGKIISEASVKGHITTAEQESFYNALQHANDNHYFSCSINLVLVTCIK